MSPEPSRIAQRSTPTPLAGLLEGNPQLAALFSVSVERSTYLVKQGSSLIEVALITAASRKPEAARSADTTFISEIELELKDGAVSDLFALGSEDRDVPSVLACESKSERGFDRLGTRADLAGLQGRADLNIRRHDRRQMRLPS